MDQEKFDALVQKLTADASRRGVVRGALTGAVATALGAVGLQAADAKKKGKGGPQAERCTPNGQRCGECKKKKNGKKRCKPCDKCCTGYAEITESGKERCQCRPSGSTCTGGFQCCGGQCEGGYCVEYGYGGSGAGAASKRGKRNR